MQTLDNFPALPTGHCCTCFLINLPFLGNILVKKLYRKESIRLCHLSPSSEKNVFCVILKEQNHVKTIKEEQLACFCLHTGFVLTDSEHSLEECRAGQR